MISKELIRELIAVGISLHIREIDYNKASSLIEDKLKDYEKNVVKNLALSDVIQQRELLIDFLDKLENSSDGTIPYLRNGVITDMYLKGNL